MGRSTAPNASGARTATGKVLTDRVPMAARIRAIHRPELPSFPTGAGDGSSSAVVAEALATKPHPYCRDPLPEIRRRVAAMRPSHLRDSTARTGEGRSSGPRTRCTYLVGVAGGIAGNSEIAKWK